ncbi:type II toxin-antitoxin system VapC family toxin [Lichenibacterium dinghuense]|uniref:type II toxin-antitoxin system VapC family toxin n=1 Tax=Lichenibacterium dinghuense TaxID=2895977 RepID=UPI001F2DB5C9|nr:type II toxin-antitoxin system VapC family toxin [Lichenibacterium sp. 6Y81]
MRLLLDTHVLLWAAAGSDRLRTAGRALIADRANRLVFSAVSICEIAIKRGLDRADFRTDAEFLRGELRDVGYEDLSVTSVHAAAVAKLPPIHKDPFDRLLIAQAIVEGITLLTADATILRYPGPIQRV